MYIPQKPPYLNILGGMRKCSYFRAIGRSFTQMIAYFLVMNSKKCTFLASTSLPSRQQLG